MPSPLLYLAILVPLVCLAIGLLAAHLYYRRIRALVGELKRRGEGGLPRLESGGDEEVELREMEQGGMGEADGAKTAVRPVGGSDESGAQGRSSRLSTSHDALRSRPPSSLSSDKHRRPFPASSHSSADRSYRLADLAYLEEGRDVVDWGQYEPMSATEGEASGTTDTGEVSASSGGTGRKASTFTRSSASLPHPFEYDPSSPFGSPHARSSPFTAPSSSKDGRSRSRFSFFASASEGDSSDTRGGSAGGGGTTSDSRTTTNSRGERVLRRGSKRALRPPHAPETPSQPTRSLRALKEKSRRSLSLKEELVEPVLPGAPPSPLRVQKCRGTFGVGEGEDTDNDADESDSLAPAEGEEGEGGARRTRSRSSRRGRSRRTADETIKAPVHSTISPPSPSFDAVASDPLVASPTSSSSSLTPPSSSFAPSPSPLPGLPGYRPSPLASTPLALSPASSDQTTPAASPPALLSLPGGRRRSSQGSPLASRGGGATAGGGLPSLGEAVAAQLEEKEGKSRGRGSVSPQPPSSGAYSSADLYTVGSQPSTSVQGNESLPVRSKEQPHDGFDLPSSFPPSPPASPPSHRTFIPPTLPSRAPPAFNPSPRPHRPAPVPLHPSPPTAAAHPLVLRRHDHAPAPNRRDDSGETATTGLSRWTTVAQQGSGASTPFLLRSGQGSLDQAVVAIEESQQQERGGEGTYTPTQSYHSHSRSASGSIFHEHLDDARVPLVEEPVPFGGAVGTGAGDEEDETLLIPQSRYELGLPWLREGKGVDSKGSLVPLGGGTGMEGGLKPTNPDPSLFAPSASSYAATDISASVYSRNSSYRAGEEG
ncbi:hypothetical protein JCM6882_001407 [Rhodosporidiobolus microsporus]